MKEIRRRCALVFNFRIGFDINAARTVDFSTWADKDRGIFLGHRQSQIEGRLNSSLNACVGIGLGIDFRFALRVSADFDIARRCVDFGGTIQIDGCLGKRVTKGNRDRHRRFS